MGRQSSRFEFIEFHWNLTPNTKLGQSWQLFLVEFHWVWPIFRSILRGKHNGYRPLATRGEKQRKRKRKKVQSETAHLERCNGPIFFRPSAYETPRLRPRSPAKMDGNSGWKSCGANRPPGSKRNSETVSRQPRKPREIRCSSRNSTELGTQKVLDVLKLC